MVKQPGSILTSSTCRPSWPLKYTGKLMMPRRDSLVAPDKDSIWFMESKGQIPRALTSSPFVGQHSDGSVTHPGSSAPDAASTGEQVLAMASRASRSLLFFLAHSLTLASEASEGVFAGSRVRVLGYQ